MKKNGIKPTEIARSGSSKDFKQGFLVYKNIHVTHAYKIHLSLNSL